MKRNVSVVCVCSAPNCCDTEQRSVLIKEIPGSVASGTHCISTVHKGLTSILEVAFFLNETDVALY